MDEHTPPGENEPPRNTKLDFPPIHKRPPFVVELLIGSVVAYIMGIASIITCEHPELFQIAIASLAFW